MMCQPAGYHGLAKLKQGIVTMLSVVLLLQAVTPPRGVPCLARGLLQALSGRSGAALVWASGSRTDMASGLSGGWEVLGFLGTRAVSGPAGAQGGVQLSECVCWGGAYQSSGVEAWPRISGEGVQPVTRTRSTVLISIILW
jgi:hypothetical protein